MQLNKWIVFDLFSLKIEISSAAFGRAGMLLPRYMSNSFQMI